jgi:hypothetical protein
LVGLLTLREEQREGVSEQAAEENVWTEEGWNNRRLQILHDEELRNLYSSPNIIRMIRSMRIRWT